MCYKRLTLAAAGVLIAALAFAVPDRLDRFHQPLARVLRDFVRQETRVASNKSYVRSVVKYDALRGNANWTEYIRQLAYIDPISLKEGPEDARKAFWINAYNAFVIDAVAANFPLTGAVANGDYPAGSLRASAAWTAPHYVAGGSYTLDGIRQILQDFRDPRVFLAINDGAISSPALPDEPYNATNVESGLDRAAQNFAADPLNYRIDRTRNKIVLSEIFRQNAQIFRDTVTRTVPELGRYPVDARAALTFLWPRLHPEHREYITNRRPAVEYEVFNWNLNLAQ